jgi:hypothetical protein
VQKPPRDTLHQAICGRAGNVEQFWNVVALTPLAVHDPVPGVQAAADGAVRTMVYAMGQKSSGNEGNCGAFKKPPTVVVTPTSVAMIGPWHILIAPALFVPNTIAQHCVGCNALNATPVFASVVGVAVAVCATSGVIHSPLMMPAVVTVVV